MTTRALSNLAKLFADNRKTAGRAFKADASGDQATIYLYDYIVDSDLEAEYWGGVSPRMFLEALAAVGGADVHLRVNSPGGSVFAARAMEQGIREYSGKVFTHVDGLAASAASFLILPSDSIEMAPGSMLMIHKAWAIGYGNSIDLAALAALLEKIDGTLVASYQSKTGKDAQIIADWMAAETWFTAQEAVDQGFADTVAQDKTPAAPPANVAPTWDLSAYTNAPGCLCGKFTDEEIASALAWLHNRKRPTSETKPPTEKQPDFATMKRRLAVASLTA